MRRPASRGQLQRRGQQCCLGCSGERLGASVASREPQHMECSARDCTLVGRGLQRTNIVCLAS